MKSVFLPVFAVALAFSVPAFAQSEAGGKSGQTPQAVTGSQSEEGNASAASKANNLLTINKLKQDLQKAGFTDIQVISDSFVVQAKDKDGNPTVMSLSPGGVFAISALQSNQNKQAKAAPSGAQTETRR